MKAAVSAAVALLLAAAPAWSGGAGIAPASRLIERDGAALVQLSGHAGDARLVSVRINGHPLAASGEGAWKAAIPVARLRAISAAHARTARVETVAVAADGRTVDMAETVRLPIGLFSHAADAPLVLASR